ncbi:MAG TPA: DNA-3-methyladenine glycosylase 2 family protein [Dehalococcoidia bacterium]|nr:DNA-3-methyladenine glycosylase 2 family protein [Dehalococcoidia bacterium]
MERAVISLKPVPPYSFSLTAAYATFFRGRYGGDIFENGLYQRLLDLKEGLCLAGVRTSGKADPPQLEVELLSRSLDDAMVARAIERLNWVLSIDRDIKPFYQMVLSDRALEPLIKDLWGLHIPHTASVYEALVQAILGQQISAHVARELRTRLIKMYGATLKVAGNIYHSFPRPDALVTAEVDGLRALGFSARKSEYIIDISRKVTSSQLDLEGLHALSDEEVIQVLTGLRGVGLWTAQWLLIRALGRNDGFPHGDLALCRILGQLLNKGRPFQPEEALEYSHRWSSYRSYITAYLFAAMRLGYAFPSVHLSPKR